MSEPTPPCPPVRAAADLGLLLRTVDRLSPRPCGMPLSLDGLHRRARRQRRRASLAIAIVAGLGFAASRTALGNTHAAAVVADAGVRHLLQNLRSERAAEDVRGLLRRQAAEMARERGAAASAAYAAHLATTDRAHAAVVLQQIAACFAGTRGAAGAAAQLARSEEQPR